MKQAELHTTHVPTGKVTVTGPWDLKYIQEWVAIQAGMHVSEYCKYEIKEL